MGRIVLKLHLIQAVAAFVFIAFISPIIFGIYFLFWMWTRFVLRFVTISCSKLDGQDVIAGVSDWQQSTIINGIVILKGKFTVEIMQRLFISRVISAKDENNKPLLPKFTQCIVEHCDYWFWKPKRHFDINEHIYYHVKNAIHSEKELKEAINEIINQPMSFSKPLWEVIVMPYLLSESEPRTVCLFRLHHTIADGVTLLRIIVSQMAENNDGMRIILEKAVSKRQAKAKVKANIQRKLAKILQTVYLFALGPLHLIRPLFRQEKHIYFGPKPANVLISDWTKNIKLETIKDIKNSTSTTVNDVIMTCVAGAIRRGFLTRNILPPKSVNISIPVSLQGPNDKLINTNNMSFVIPKLPTGDMDCFTRLKKIKMIMDEIKASPEIAINRLSFKFIGRVLPNSLMKISLSFSPSGIICSNVPGPNHSIFWAGHEVENFFPLGQTRGNTGFGIVIFSYMGHVNVSVTLDAALTLNPSDASMMLKAIEGEIDHLYSSVVKVIPHN
ncbi:hypothetical protein CHUAL_003845 [Chamberlinius hualienensis]